MQISKLSPENHLHCQLGVMKNNKMHYYTKVISLFFNVIIKSMATYCKLLMLKASGYNSAYLKVFYKISELVAFRFD